MILPSRRRFLLGAGALLTAPAIVRVASIMPVSVIEPASAYGMSPAMTATELLRLQNDLALDTIIRMMKLLDVNSLPWFAPQLDAK